jgi:hypothetical protein
MKWTMLAILSFLFSRAGAQGDSNLAATSAPGNLGFIIGIIIVIVVGIAMYFLLKKEDK